MEKPTYSDSPEFQGSETQELTREMIQLWMEKNTQVTTVGIDNLQESGPMILAANHESSLDPFIIRNILSVIGRQDLDVLTKKESVSGPEEGIILTGEGWLESCMESISQDRIILIFPEGAVTGEKSAHSGVVVLAKKAGLPILPVHIEGSDELGSAEDILSKISHSEFINEPVNISATIGAPELYNESQDLVNKIYDL
jgi:1-acyl-sn-glycerol-3-phosphate acyltransferase